MENKEILQKAIEKVQTNGYQLDQGLLNFCPDSIEELCFYYENGYLTADTIDGYETYPYSIKDMIFSHDFAKAFWGEKEHDLRSDYDSRDGADYCSICHTDYNYGWYAKNTKYCWQYHLQQMVLEEEPLKYLEQFLND